METFGVSQEAARQLARRRGWQRRTPNEPNETARIFVLDDAYVRPCAPVNGEQPASIEPVANGEDRAAETTVRAFERAITTLAAQLERADRRGDQEAERAAKLETMLEAAHGQLADAVAAERIASGEAAATGGYCDGSDGRFGGAKVDG